VSKEEKIHGIITRGVGGLYGVRTADDRDTELLCRARGVFRKEGITPSVGDDVLISKVSGNDENIPDDIAREMKKQKKNGVEVDHVID
jgi:ribosome biogenesis GTPase